MQWELEWGSKIFFSHGETNSRGVAILIKREVPVKVINSWKDENGRVMAITLDTDCGPITICAIYAPNKDEPQFFTGLFEAMFQKEGHKIYVGDFILVIDPKVDRKGQKCNYEKACETVKQAMEEMCLAEVWRDRKPGVKRYSYFRKKPSMASRLDFALVSKGLDTMVTSIFYIPASMTNHSAIYLNIQFSDQVRGNGYWKFNDSHLKRTELLKEMNEMLGAKLEHEYCHLDPKSKWETLVFDMSNLAQEWSREYSNEKRMIISQLYENLSQLEKDVSKNDGTDSKKEDIMFRTKEDLYELENEAALGTIFRCAMKWHVEAKRNRQKIL